MKPNYRLRIYISGPITLGVRMDNVRLAVDAYKQLIERGYAPMCPHLSHFAEEMGCVFEHQTWIDIDLPFVEVSHAVLRLPGESKGADMEVEHAALYGIPTFHSIEDLEAWRNGR